MCLDFQHGDACPNRRDQKLAGWSVDFLVYAGATDSGAAVDKLTVSLDLGGGSEGHVTSDNLPIGTYTVCEVPLAYFENAAQTLAVDPMPTGAHEQQLGDNCIVVELNPGIAQLMFRDVESVLPEAAAANGVQLPAGPQQTLPATDAAHGVGDGSSSGSLLLVLLVLVTGASAALVMAAPRQRVRRSG